MNPFGRIPFHELHRFRKRHCRRQTQKQVNVICHSTDGERSYSVLPSYPAEVRIEAFANFRSQGGIALLGREDAMKK
jgi:hypothetical protein